MTAHAPSPSSLAPPIHRVSEAVRRIGDGVRHTLCGLRGHAYLLHSAAGQLSLRCYACGSQTHGWTIDVGAPFRRPGPPRARVAEAWPHPRSRTATTESPLTTS